ncbi:MAG TPA: molybdate ABC transporter substrate-binding protein [Stellaceae bacterium]|jgi:molybdate transport system substrate-binding protein|nr:molybdate ABC transporter substrate-binding protein [Stellaceae bacterium]
MQRLLWLAALALALGGGTPALAGDVTVLSAGATRSVLQELMTPFQSGTGNHITYTFDTAGYVERRLKDGEVFDVAVTTKPRLQKLETAGAIVAGSVVVLGRSPLALVVPSGAPKPDISSVDAFKKAMLAAKSIAYTDPASGATSGIHMAQVMRDLGIADAIEAKTVLIRGYAGATPAVGEAVAKREAEIGLQPMSELMNTPGIDIVGPIPEQLQTPDLIYAVGLLSKGGEREASAAFIKLLTGPTGQAVIKAKGFIPSDGN